MLPAFGLFDLGESRPQELWRKSREMSDLSIRWHLIGHLQRNKIKPTVNFTTLIHAVDSIRLLEELTKQKEPVDVLLEVNASREPNKHGFAPDQVSAVTSSLCQFANVRVIGLMTMAAYSDNPEDARAAFREVRLLAEQAKLSQLSMGMSNDFEVAIEEGATLIRLGTILFEGLPSD